MRRENAAKKIGLTTQEAQRLLARDGPNVLKGTKKVKPIVILASQFKDVLVGILLVATVLSVIMGEVGEAVAILVIVFLNALLGFVQEYRTEKTLEALKNMAAPGARVIRDGIETSIPAREVVVEDILVLDAGDRIAADAVLLECSDFACDESILTGESASVGKKQDNLAYMGTVVTKGRARARVVATAMNTEMGRIAGMIDEIQEEPTPLQKRLAQLGKYIAIGCLAVCAVVSLTGILRGEDPFQMLLTGISLAVAAVPEGLPAIVTISLALAVSRMLRRRALVRKLAAVETLGCAGVICSDKTGTITENKMTVTTIVTPDGVYEVTGAGYEMNGEIRSAKGSKPQEDQALKRVLEISVLCSNANLYGNHSSPASRIKLDANAYEATGEPTEIALLIAAAKEGVTKELLERGYTRQTEVPFDSERKRMAVLVSSAGSDNKLLVKGAPDMVLARCAYILKQGAAVPISAEHLRWAHNQLENMAKNALRVLGFAYKLTKTSEASADEEQGLVFVGLAGMIDPPRREVYEAIRLCRRAGIRPVMITGDHVLTAEAIARDIRLLTDGDKLLTGAQLDTMDDAALLREVSGIAVYARVTPAHKLRIVRAIKKSGHVVAMTGDGVNDAPAVKEADIGAAMGIGGTDVTREAASLVLLDDNFATLIAAVEEGRVIYQNIRKFIRYLISCNLGEVLTMFGGMIMGLPVVLLPIQILLVNLVTDGLPAIALGLEPPEQDVMTKHPRSKEESVFSGGLLTAIVFRGCLIGLATLGTFVSIYKTTQNVEAARTAALLTLIFSQLIHVFECKSEKRSLFSIHFFSNPKLILAVLVSGFIALLSVYWKPMSSLFNTVLPTGRELFFIAAYTLASPIISWFIGLFLHGRKKEQVPVDSENEFVNRHEPSVAGLLNTTEPMI